MDQTTQQNAALVEEMAAAASSLKSQANDLVQVVAVFKLGNEDARSHVPASSAAPARSGASTGSHLATPLPRAAVRSHPPKVSNFAGPERRAGASASTSKPAAKPATKPASAAHKPPPVLLSAAPKTSSRATPAGGDDDWETF